MPRAHSRGTKSVNTPLPPSDLTGLEVKFEERDGESIVTSNYTAFLAQTRPHVVKLLGRKGIASGAARTESLEQTLLADWDVTSDVQSSDFARMKPAIEREILLVRGLVEDLEKTLAESKTSVGSGGNHLLQEYSRYSCAIAAGSFAVLGGVVGTLEGGAEQSFAKLLRDFDSKIWQDIADNSIEQQTSDMLAFKRLRAQQLATKKIGLDRSALGSVVLAMKPLCDLATRCESFGGGQTTVEVGASGRLSARFQEAFEFYEGQASAARAIGEQASKSAQDALKDMKARYKDESIREELRRIRSSSLKLLTGELAKYCSGDTDSQDVQETDSKDVEIAPSVPDTQDGPRTEPSHVEAGSTVESANAPKSTNKKKRRAFYGHKQKQTAEPSSGRSVVLTGWQPTQSDNLADEAPWQRVETSSGSKSSGPVGKQTREAPGPFAHYGWTFNDMFHRNIVIGKDSKIHKRAMQPDPDFGSHPLLSRAAASFFLKTTTGTASELALSPEQLEAREEWRGGAEQRNADWANVWDQSVLTQGKAEGSETVQRAASEQHTDDSDTEGEDNDAEDTDLPQGVATGIPLTDYLGDLTLEDNSTADSDVAA